MSLEEVPLESHHQPMPNYSSTASSFTPPTLPSSYFHSLPSLDASRNCYGHQNGDYSSEFPAMPLNSDGSLCIMGASRSSSVSQGTAPAPKLEDFFGAGTTHDSYITTAQDEKLKETPVETSNIH